MTFEEIKKVEHAQHLTRVRQRRARTEQRKRIAAEMLPLLTNAEKEIVLEYGMLVILSDCMAGVDNLSDDMLHRLVQQLLNRRTKKEPA